MNAKMKAQTAQCSHTIEFAFLEDSFCKLFEVERRIQERAPIAPKSKRFWDVKKSQEFKIVQKDQKVLAIYKVFTFLD